jgi:hypothetical protein
MTTRQPVDDAALGELTEFVRTTLGCGCPEEVVDRTVIDVDVSGETGLDVGGRLLVRFVDRQDTEQLIEEFPEIVERHREERDRRGFRRLRLVVIHEQSGLLAPVLDDMIDILWPTEDRLHVHVVPAAALPSLLLDRARSP